MMAKIHDNIPKFYGTTVLGERGQMVIPVEARREANLEPGTKIVVLGGPRGDILMLAKADSIAEMMAHMMDHMSHIEKLIKSDDATADDGGE